MISQDRIKEVLLYSPLTGLFVWGTPTARRIKRGDIAGCPNSDDYLMIRVDGELHFAHHLAWLYVYGSLPNSYIDHINRDTRDNRIINLREVTNSCNVRNSAIRIDNKSGVKGVSFDKNRGMWVSKISNKFIGYFQEFDEAVLSRYAAEQCLEWNKCDKYSHTKRYIENKIIKKP